MFFFRSKHKYPTHPSDKRVLLIENIEDFRLWRERSKLGVSGIVLKTPIPAEVLNAAVKEILKDRPFEFNGICTLEEFREKLRTDWEDHSWPNLVQIYSTAAQILEHAGPLKQDGNEDICVNTFVDHYQPDDFHAHSAALTFAFQQAGTICTSGKTPDRGKVYGIETGQFALIGPEIYHKAPEEADDWKEKPRVNFVIS